MEAYEGKGIQQLWKAKKETTKQCKRETKMDWREEIERACHFSGKILRV